MNSWLACKFFFATLRFSSKYEFSMIQHISYMNLLHSFWTKFSSLCPATPDLSLSLRLLCYLVTSFVIRIFTFCRVLCDFLHSSQSSYHVSTTALKLSPWRPHRISGLDREEAIERAPNKINLFLHISLPIPWLHLSSNEIGAFRSSIPVLLDRRIRQSGGG